MAADFQLCRSPQEFVAGISWLIHRLRPVTHPSSTSFWTQRHCCLSFFFFFGFSSLLSLSLSKLGSLKFLRVCLCCNVETRAVSEFHPGFRIFHCCVGLAYLNVVVLTTEEGENMIRVKVLRLLEGLTMIYNVRTFLYTCFRLWPFRKACNKVEQYSKVAQVVFQINSNSTRRKCKLYLKELRTIECLALTTADSRANSFLPLCLLFSSPAWHCWKICSNFSPWSVDCLLSSIHTSGLKKKTHPWSCQEWQKWKISELFWRSLDMSRHVTDPVIMRIHLIVCINRRANDTFKSPFAFRQRESNLRDMENCHRV